MPAPSTKGAAKLAANVAAKVSEAPAPVAAPAPDFFASLSELPIAAEAQSAFDRLFAPGAGASQAGRTSTRSAAPAVSPSDLYRALMSEALAWLGLPRSSGGLTWEWRPLLVLEGEADPFYITESQIARRLSECPPMSVEQREALQRIVQGFLGLRRDGVLARVTALATPAFQRAWVSAFPAEFAWASLDALRTLGVLPLGSAGGWRSFRRFTAGVFDAPRTSDALVAWEQACAAVSAASEPSDTAAAHRAGFSAAAFAGELTALGIEGPCGASPRCDACGLRTACMWANSQASDRARSGEVTESVHARARLGGLEALSLEALLDGLFALPAAEREHLRSRLRGHSLRDLAAKSAIELEEWIGADAELHAARWLLLFELCRRFGEERLKPGVGFVVAQDVFQHFRLRFRDLKQERLIVVLLDVKKRYLSDVLVTQGTLDQSQVHAREIFAPAVRERAAYVLLVHNHPSGDPAPSEDDVDVTRTLEKLGIVLGIPVLDHVIVADEKFFSFRESNRMEP
jgi:DNA repair protein RadC